MIRDYQKACIVDEKGKNDLIVEVNWNPNDPKTNECKILKLTYPDGKTAFVKRDLLNSFLFAIGTESQQRELIPQTIHKVKWYETILSVKATKNIKKGEQVTFPIKITLPVTEEEYIGKKKFGGSPIVKPPPGVIRG